MNCFYCSQLKSTDSTVDLQAEEFRHIASARRLKVGDELVLFTGKGLVANARIAAITKHKLTASVITIKEHKLPVPKIILATAIPKGDRINTLLDMSTQLGMSDFIPLICERSVAAVNPNKLQRFKRICINACKQSERYFIPNIHASASLNEVLKKYKNSSSQIMLADPGGQPLVMSFMTEDEFNDVQNLVFLVGPEGGFSDTELTMLADHDLVKLKLSDAILRIETACVSLLSQISNRQIS